MERTKHNCASTSILVLVFMMLLRVHELAASPYAVSDKCAACRAVAVSSGPICPAASAERRQIMLTDLGTLWPTVCRVN